MSQPLDRRYEMPALGAVDEERGEFWIENPFKIAESGENLSAYEKNRLYMGQDGSSFLDVSFASGANLDSDSRAAICADFNDDGAVDMLICSVGGGPLRLFLNRFPNRGNHVRIDLTGTKSNRTAIGSQVTIHCGDRKITRGLFAQNGFMGQSPPEMLVGLGDAVKIDRIDVRWPTGQVQSFQDLPVNSRIAITEGEDAPTVADFESAIEIKED